MNSKSYRITILVAITLAVSGICANAQDIKIIYDNDVHCFVDGYSAAAALKNQAIADGYGACLVSSGDFIQGGSLGASTKGGCIVDIMNAAGYDFVTLGNHEFDYGVPRLKELSQRLEATIVDCNLIDLSTGERMFAPYGIIKFGKKAVAFIGITTPYAFVSSVPSYFKDKDGNMAYSLCAENIYETIQQSIDQARSEGADYVVVLSHLGDNMAFDIINSHELIFNTTGIDAVLDGHAHHYIPDLRLTDKGGKEVILTSTGSYLENIGCLTITEKGVISTRLIPSEEVKESDAKTLAAIEKAKKDYEQAGARIIGKSEVELIAADEDSPRIVRERESGLGDFCADALRLTLDTEVSLIGGGSIRAGIPQGKVTYNDIFTCFPFRNTICTAVLSGQQILDVLEFAVANLPVESGGFMQVSGMKFEVDVQTDTPAMVDANKVFTAFTEGPRRVRNLQVLNPDGSFSPVDKDRNYSVAASSYLLIEHGDGFNLFDDVKANDTQITDVDLLERYITENLKGIIPTKYAKPEGRIKINY